MTKSIVLLDEKTVNKIAAGEVVERPSSVVKELIENSIDANANSITIEINKGGKKSIRITDNGTGINKKDIELAFLRHSTSKISKVEDLEGVRTLGFRGEALASIAAVSQLEIITKTAEDMSGVKVAINGGTIDKKSEVGCPKGTTIIVNNLFYNIPVRKEFLKSDNVEASYIGDIVYKLAISHPSISFTYIRNNKLVIKTPGSGDIKSTIYSLLGKEFIDSALELNGEKEDIKIHGFICKPSLSRGNRSSQYIFVNDRYIKDEGISGTIESMYKSVIPINRYPVFLLFISVETNKVDINIHPTKTEVRFSNKDDIISLIGYSVKKTLSSNNLIPQVTFLDPKKVKNNDTKIVDEEQMTVDLVKPYTNFHKNSEDKLNLTKKGTTHDITMTKAKNKDLEIIDFNADKEKYDIANNDVGGNDKKIVYEKNVSNYGDVGTVKFPDINIIGRLFDTYILTEDKLNKSFYIIDQHAAHERIMYEKIKYELEKQEICTQALLVPEIINLTNRELSLVEENLNVFLKLGFDLDSFSNNSIALRGVPVVLGTPNSKQLFLDILDNLERDIKSSYELYLEKIMKIACTSAIKANDNIKNIEMNTLIKDLKRTKDPFTCPHGRPVIIEITNYELEKKFKRIQ